MAAKLRYFYDAKNSPQVIFERKFDVELDMNKIQTGKKGEREALYYLLAKGYKLIARNKYVKQFELDLIMKDKSVMVFVEVKTRTSLKFGLPENAVDQKKKEHIIEASDVYLQDIEWSGEFRFDIVSVLIESNELIIRHFEDAFWATDLT